MVNFIKNNMEKENLTFVGHFYWMKMYVDWPKELAEKLASHMYQNQLDQISAQKIIRDKQFEEDLKPRKLFSFL